MAPAGTRRERKADPSLLRRAGVVALAPAFAKAAAGRRGMTTLRIEAKPHPLSAAADKGWATRCVPRPDLGFR
jgi:hypothetical protein